MSYNGSGTFSINTAGQPVVTGTVITSTAFNALTADLANGLSTALCKDGQSTPTANIGLGNFKITSLGNGTAATDAVNLSQVQSSAASYLSVSGADTIIATASPALTAYAAGNVFYFAAAGTNTGAVTLNIDGLGAKAITRDGSTALVAGDLVANSEVVVVYDGTRFQVLNSNSKTNFNLSGTLTAASTATATKFIPTGGTATGNGMYLPTTNTLAWSTNSSERMRLDSSGNLGIGTTSPVTKLNVANAAGSPTGVSVGAIRVYETTNNYGLNIGGDGTYGYIQGLRGATSTTAYNDLVFQPNSGNVGIGVTPSAWAGGRLAIQLAGNAFLQGRTGGTLQTVLGNNYYHDGTGFKYVSTGTASGIDLSGGGCAWYTAASGSAGAAVSLTQAMTLDVSGNLGVGMTPSAWVGSWKAVQGQGSGGVFAVASGGNGMYVMGNSYYNASGSPVYTSSSYATMYQQVNGTHAFYTAASGTAGNTITFTQVLTLDASGNLSVGTSATSGRLTVRQDSTTASPLYIINAAVSGKFASFEGNGAIQGSITWSGSTTAYNTTSDQRLKKNITDADSASNLIDAIKVRQFDWESDNTHQRYGMIAQELYDVAPEAVYAPEDPDAMMAVDYSKLVPMLIKEIQSLRSRVAQLETK